MAWVIDWSLWSWSAVLCCAVLQPKLRGGRAVTPDTIVRPKASRSLSSRPRAPSLKDETSVITANVQMTRKPGS
ncbi:uncharacterized protein RAG0_07195 [Rhynchosporium agropyri]|uniref:Secreted protein n=1 Tax=Rhynchosporium agropyri TaxID=914238 RepID=A0A1E1KKA9_9HELO|nr:uncharacterized protein RAG0_07195 [Rhynchosporium agropyri]